ncbi:MAG: hypothetical protein CML56_00080 [Rhodobacteraceae bacterium]|nr:hypothetical protein [Paracoccaceae bacterium]|tara:strand:- start:318 stop:638 length:321 start_codon:yes stop_codon:yes gene_type:complete
MSKRKTKKVDKRPKLTEDQQKKLSEVMDKFKNIDIYNVLNKHNAFDPILSQATTIEEAEEADKLAESVSNHFNKIFQNFVDYFDDFENMEKFQIKLQEMVGKNVDR